MKKKRKIVLHFRAIIDYDTTIDDKTLQEDYGGNMTRAMRYLYKEAGIFFDEPLVLTEAIEWRKP